MREEDFIIEASVSKNFEVYEAFAAAFVGLIIFVVLLINLGCNVHVKSELEASTQSSEKRLVIVENCSSEKQQEWVANCIKDANPKSDEEPEDWIRQCYSTSVKLFCGSNCGVYTDGAVKCYEEFKKEFSDT